VPPDPSTRVTASSPPQDRRAKKQGDDVATTNYRELAHRHTDLTQGPPMTSPDTARPTPGITVRLLDGFRLTAANQSVPVIPSSQRLLAFLALHESPVSRIALAEALWPGIPDKRGAARLRSALWRLVKPPHALVQVDQGMLSLGTEVSVDVAAVRRFAAEIAVPASGTRPGSPPASLSSDLLPGWTEQWVIAERDWFRQLCLRTLEVLSERFRAVGDHFNAQETAVAAVRGDPLRESAHRRLIELHLADNNPAAALRQYAAYRALLHTELGLTPSPEIRRLLDPLLSRAHGSARAH
jgi:DNA-binding SARP family transcriptional activator